MTNIELKKKWSGISDNTISSGFRSLRISAECICDLYISVSSLRKRCLILALPDSKRIDFKGVQKENLTIEYFEEKNLLILQLNDLEFNDLFDDLVISVYNGIKNIVDVDEYSNYFIRAFYRWSEFFEDKKSDLLSEDAIKGIFGELLILKLFITDKINSEINFLLNSWTGLYDKGNDFEFEEKNIEVKTKSIAGTDVKISSEFQLEVSRGKGLELYIVSLQSDFTKGIHIRDLLLETKNLIQLRSGDCAILWKALNQKNITAKNIQQYDQYKFLPINWISYNCADCNFPKLSRSNIPDEVSELKYSLRVSLLTQFIIQKSDF